MRLWHTIYAVFLAALLMTVARAPAGRVALVVFITGVCELACGLTAIMLLFQSMGSLGNANGLFEAMQSVVITVVILTVSGYLMVGILTIGWILVQRVV